ncbi:MAG: DUF2202 domain-containing protein [Spirochaetales bacterium]|nr:DUF2202 domain-containing protein [Spirochaetales bacterium]
MKNIFLTVLLLLTAGTASLTAESFGSAGSFDDDDYTLAEMLKYAMEDEQMALAEYEAIMAEFNLDRPYSNIADSEKTHISYLEELYVAHNIEIPYVDVESHLIVPGSSNEAASLGVEAEINNIAMYEKFLAGDLPQDVREVFEYLKKGSENHLKAFERQVERGTASNSGRRR